MRIRLYWKLTFIFCSLTILIITAAYFYLNANLKTYIEIRIQENLKKDLLLNQNLLDNELNQKINPIGAEDIAARIGRYLGLRTTIIDPDGIVIGDSEINKNDL